MVRFAHEQSKGGWGAVVALTRSIRGLSVLVTGAGSGIGRATARLLAEEGARVVATDTAIEAVAALADALCREGHEARGRVLDVSSDAGVANVVAALTAEFGGLDILVNCAGVSFFGGLEDAASWERTFDVNLRGMVRTIAAARPWLERSAAGRVVNVASTEGIGATRGIPAYTASKHAVIGLTRSMAVELARRGVTVNAVCPGPIRTGMTALIPESAKEVFARRRVPLGRYGEPEEVAHAILGLVVPAASFITGAVLVVDGGLTVTNT